VFVFSFIVLNYLYVTVAASGEFIVLATIAEVGAGGDSSSSDSSSISDSDSR